MVDSLSPYYAELYAYAFRRLGSGDEAADVVQEAFARVLRRDDVDSLSQPRAYLYRIVVNLIHDQGRRASRAFQVTPVGLMLENETAAEELTPAEVLAKREANEQLREAIAALPLRCREVFELHRFGGLRHREIAARLGISQSTVEKHIAAALVHLRRRMADWV